jgi:Flp pilus assembly protein TadG
VLTRPLVEVVLITPLLILAMSLIVAAARLAEARLQVDSAAVQASRAASTARGPAAAVASAQVIAQAALASRHITCSPLTVTAGLAGFRPGGQVRVQVSCTVPLAGLSLLHLPGTLTLHSQFVSPVGAGGTRG